ncbi:MAG TPA: sodium:solute symporter family protein [Bryobacteraceae bacterium]
MQIGAIFGVGFVTAVITLTALVSGLRVRSTREFTVAGHRARWPIVSGIIVGALVGGSSTVGTAQAAFVYGLPAWWFTLGAGIGCLILGTLFLRPLRRTGVETLPQYLMTAFGQPIRPLVAVCDSIGIFITIPGQAASAIALLTVLLGWTLPRVVALVAALIVIYVLTGGAISAGVAGFVKLLIAFAALLVFGAVALFLAGGVAPLQETLPGKYFSLFGNGFWKDIGNGLGIVFGVLTTQVYAQAVLSGRDERQSRIGTLLAGVGTMVSGLGGVAVGMFMRVREPGIAPAQALPLFATHYFSPVVGGVMLGAILITVITCAGGLALGIATMLTRDLYQQYLRPKMGDREGLLTARSVIVVVVVAGALIGGSDLLKLIISYSFLAFAFRADAMLVPVVVAVLGNRTSLRSAGAGVGALLGGMTTNLFWNLAVEPGGAAVFIGLVGSVVGLAGGHALSILRDKRAVLQAGVSVN